MTNTKVNRRPITLEPSWFREIGDELQKEYIQDLSQFLRLQKSQGAVIYPPGELIFAALNTTPFDDVRVVIIGQDPYHGSGQANGLCFSVAPGVAVPPSLRNIYIELQADLGVSPRAHGNLRAWAEQGVLLLNSVLTVQAGKAGSHRGRGWEQFTDHIISTLSQKRENLVFLLWGAYAQNKGHIIDRQRHHILTAPHPSPFSAHSGFIGCQHFSKANRYLTENGLTAIDWELLRNAHSVPAQSAS